MISYVQTLLNLTHQTYKSDREKKHFHDLIGERLVLNSAAQNRSYLSLTVDLKITKIFGERIDAEIFTSAARLTRHGVRKPAAGAENTSISGSEINRRQRCR